MTETTRADARPTNAGLIEEARALPAGAKAADSAMYYIERAAISETNVSLDDVTFVDDEIRRLRDLCGRLATALESSERALRAAEAERDKLRAGIREARGNMNGVGPHHCFFCAGPLDNVTDVFSHYACAADYNGDVETLRTDLAQLRAEREEAGKQWGWYCDNSHRVRRTGGSGFEAFVGGSVWDPESWRWCDTFAEAVSVAFRADAASAGGS